MLMVAIFWWKDRWIQFLCFIPTRSIIRSFQLLNKHFGGGVSREQVREDGKTEIKVDNKCPLFEGLQPEETVRA